VTNAPLKQETSPPPKKDFSTGKPNNDTAPSTAEASTGPSVLPGSDLKGKVFIVTGGGRGLGLTMAEGLLEAGATGKLLRAINYHFESGLIVHL
jgi:hypothetical protein